MAIYKFNNNSLQKVQSTSLRHEGILERQNLQSAMKQQISVIAPDCLVIAEEFSDWSDSNRRIDLLAVDKQANLVVIELKRGETGAHMELQALRYAAMVSTMTFRQAVEAYDKYLTDNAIEANAEQNILDFLEWEQPQDDAFALDIRMILVSEDFSREVTTSVLWLNERSLDIQCVRLTSYKHKNEVLVDVQQVIPLPEAEEYQVKVRQQKTKRIEARQSTNDYSRYEFEGQEYGKNRLVLAVIQHWMSKHQPQSFSDLVSAFPQSLHGGKLFVTNEEAIEELERSGRKRHFINEEEILSFPDGTRYALTNQWGAKKLPPFLEHAHQLGYAIERVDS